MYRRVVIKRECQKGPRRVINTFIGRIRPYLESVFEIIIEKFIVEIEKEGYKNWDHTGDHQKLLLLP